jgi:hypothetical protein
MYIGGSARPLSALEELELRRDRLQELITLQLVSPSLGEQIRKAITQLDQQIATARDEQRMRLAA